MVVITGVGNVNELPAQIASGAVISDMVALFLTIIATLLDSIAPPQELIALYCSNAPFFSYNTAVPAVYSAPSKYHLPSVTVEPLVVITGVGNDNELPAQIASGAVISAIVALLLTVNFAELLYAVPPILVALTR